MQMTDGARCKPLHEFYRQFRITVCKQRLNLAVLEDVRLSFSLPLSVLRYLLTTKFLLEILVRSLTLKNHSRTISLHMSRQVPSLLERLLDAPEMTLVIPAPSLTLKIYFRVYHSHVSGQSVVSAESLLLATELTPDLLLLSIVDCVLMSGEIVRTTEDGVARFARARVDTRAFVWTRLRIASGKSAAGQTRTEVDRLVGGVWR